MKKTIPAINVLPPDHDKQKAEQAAILESIMAQHPASSSIGKMAYMQAYMNKASLMSDEQAKHSDPEFYAKWKKEKEAGKYKNEPPVPANVLK